MTSREQLFLEKFNKFLSSECTLFSDYHYVASIDFHLIFIKKQRVSQAFLQVTPTHKGESDILQLYFYTVNSKGYDSGEKCIYLYLADGSLVIDLDFRFHPTLEKDISVFLQNIRYFGMNNAENFILNS